MLPGVSVIVSLDSFQFCEAIAGGRRSASRGKDRGSVGGVGVCGGRAFSAKSWYVVDFEWVVCLSGD